MLTSWPECRDGEGWQENSSCQAEQSMILIDEILYFWNFPFNICVP
jgi:hypothetical protein